MRSNPRVCQAALYYITWYVLDTYAPHHSVILIRALPPDEFVRREDLCGPFPLTPLAFTLRGIGDQGLVKAIKPLTVTADIRFGGV